MLTVGLTGGIGSGKSTVAKIFKSLDAPVYFADDRAKELMNSNKYLVESIKTEFGNSVYNSSGELQRDKLAKVVFRDETKLAKLNALVHPEVLKDAQRWMAVHNAHAYILKEAALLFEAGTAKDLDFMITVTAPDELRIQRVISRDSCTKQQVIDRMTKQIDQEEKARLSDFIIINDGKKSLINQVNRIHETLMPLR